MVCHYEPKGNMRTNGKGDPVYEAGEPCTGCRKNQKCEPEGDGLCTEEGDEVTEKPIRDGVSQTVTCDGAVQVMSQSDP